ncbi:LysE family transporter [Peribacillus frigoritolerans]|uniref:LysE family transporter n=1 Tax=Peribacillus frigoritolerans TaxID=450367 RepID=UPI00105A1DF5|nr:LysE family transporter [Peribacillus frigoritolerans]TDL80083.1 amino acid transporter [Peribacillus frigoritolerans]
MESLFFIVKPIVLGISLAAPIGPIKLEMIKRGIMGGFWPAMLVGIGAITVDMILMFGIFLGLVTFLESTVFSAILSAVGSYLLAKLGINSILRSLSAEKMLKSDDEKKIGAGSYWTGFFIALGNPFIFIFWLGVYGSALTSLGPHHTFLYLLIYSLLIIAGVTLWNLNIALTVHFIRDYIKDRMLKAITFAAGVILLGFSIKLFIQMVGFIT